MTDLTTQIKTATEGATQPVSFQPSQSPEVAAVNAVGFAVDMFKRSADRERLAELEKQQKVFENDVSTAVLQIRDARVAVENGQATSTQLYDLEQRVLGQFESTVQEGIVDRVNKLTKTTHFSMAQGEQEELDRQRDYQLELARLSPYASKPLPESPEDQLNWMVEATAAKATAEKRASDLALRGAEINTARGEQQYKAELFSIEFQSKEVPRINKRLNDLVGSMNLDNAEDVKEIVAVIDNEINNLSANVAQQARLAYGVGLTDQQVTAISSPMLTSLKAYKDMISQGWMSETNKTMMFNRTAKLIDQMVNHPDPAVRMAGQSLQFSAFSQVPADSADWNQFVRYASNLFVDGTLGESSSGQDNVPVPPLREILSLPHPSVVLTDEIKNYNTDMVIKAFTGTRKKLVDNANSGVTYELIEALANGDIDATLNLSRTDEMLEAVRGPTSQLFTQYFMAAISEKSLVGGISGRGGRQVVSGLDNLTIDRSTGKLIPKKSMPFAIVGDTAKQYNKLVDLTFKAYENLSITDAEKSAIISKLESIIGEDTDGEQ